jgi:hypothetical protein
MPQTCYSRTTKLALRSLGTANVVGLNVVRLNKDSCATLSKRIGTVNTADTGATASLTLDFVPDRAA